MNKIFKKLGDIFERKPFKTLFITIAVFAVMIMGAFNIGMSTGSHTLVQKDNKAYISNFEMEKEFGSDAIMILFEGESDELLGLNNLTKLYNIEQKLRYTDGIFTIMSPSSVVHQITDKQIKEIKDQVPNMSDGLNEIGLRLQSIGEELNTKNLPNPSMLDEKINELTSSLSSDNLIGEFEENEKELKEKFQTMSFGLSEMGDKLKNIGEELVNKEIPNPSDLEEKLSELENITLIFDDLIEGQYDLGIGIINMETGLTDSANGIGEISNQLMNMSSSLEDGNPLKEKLNTMAKQLAESSNGINQIAQNSSQLTQGTTQTSSALENMSVKLSNQLKELKDGIINGGLEPEEFKQMSHGFIMMGENLDQLSQGMTSIDISDIAPDTSSVFSKISSKINIEMEEIKSIFNEGLDPSELKTMANGFISMGENLIRLSDGLGMFSDKSGMVVAEFPHNENELNNILYEDNRLREVFEETVIDDNHIMMMIKLNGNIDDSDIDTVYKEIQNVVRSENLELDYTISGKPVLDSELRNEMKSNMQIMVISAVVVMFVILSFVFKVRWKTLSLGIVFISVLATLGLMGHLNVSMTMVSMAVFPILIGLGVDYSIQIQNRYEEEKSVSITLKQIGVAVGKAVIATVLGFISLYASPVPMIQDFGKMLTIGVLVSFIGSIFLLLPILKSRDLVDNKENVDASYMKSSFMEKLLSSIGKFSMKFSLVIVLVSIILAVMGLSVDSNVGVETDIETFMPQDMIALHDIHKVRDLVGSTNQMNLFFEDDDILSEENIKWTQDIIEKIKVTYPKQVVDIKSVDNLVNNISTEKELTHSEYLDVVENIPNSQKKMFINEKKDKSVILMNVEHMATEELQAFVSDMYNTIETSPMKVAVTGKSVLDVEMVKGLTDGRLKMTLIGLALVFAALLIMYKSSIKAFVVVFPVVIIVGMSGGIMYLFGLKYTPITATLGALILGMGTETNIMLLERYLEERNNGNDRDESINITLRQIGAATLASGLTTVGGFSVLMTSKFVILKDFGLMTVINIALELISTFILLPAVIWLFDKLLIKKINHKGGI